MYRRTVAGHHAYRRSAGLLLPRNRRANRRCRPRCRVGRRCAGGGRGQCGLRRRAGRKQRACLWSGRGCLPRPAVLLLGRRRRRGVPFLPDLPERHAQGDHFYVHPLRCYRGQRLLGQPARRGRRLHRVRPDLFVRERNVYLCHRLRKPGRRRSLPKTENVALRFPIRCRLPVAGTAARRRLPRRERDLCVRQPLLSIRSQVLGRVLGALRRAAVGWLPIASTATPRPRRRWPTGCRAHSSPEAVHRISPGPFPLLPATMAPRSRHEIALRSSASLPQGIWALLWPTAWCPRNHRRWSCSLSMVEIENSTEVRPADDLAARSILVGRVLDQPSTEPLMEPFPMVVRHEFLDHVAQVPFTEEPEMVETLVSRDDHGECAEIDRGGRDRRWEPS